MASVAEAVIASPSARPRVSAACIRPGLRLSRAAAPIRTRLSGTPAIRIPATAAKESCQPGSAQERGFSASVTAAASSSAYQREAGRERVSAAIPATPMTPARCSDGPAPASGT